MKYYVEENFSDFEPWSGAVSTWQRIIDEGKADEADRYLEEIEPADGWTKTAINDLLWFDSDLVYKALGMRPDGCDERTADEIGNAWISDNDGMGYKLQRVEIEADGVTVYYIDEDDETQEEQSEELDAEDVARLFGDSCGEIDDDAGLVYTWRN